MHSTKEINQPLDFKNKNLIHTITNNCWIPERHMLPAGNRKYKTLFTDR